MGSFPETYYDPSIYQRGLNSKQLRNNYVKYHSLQSETACNTKLKILKVTASSLMQPAKEYASPHKSISYFNQ